ncbi:MAG: phosphate acyltransferase PlsX [Balneolaceae bacterium]
MVIAVDAAGGDHFPEYPVQGALEALGERSDLKILLVGPSGPIEDVLSEASFDKSRISVLDAPEVIGMNESPASAVKSKRHSSIVSGIGAHRNGECEAFVSAGNTGALLAASTLILGRLENVQRPTIAATFPTLRGFRLLLDAGANLELKPESYVQFARMASIYAEEVMRIDDPKIGLLNVGEEPEKGTELHKTAFNLLASLPHFIGNVEGKDIFSAKADVYLCDGFSGNLILKFGESIPAMIQDLLHGTFGEMKVDEKTRRAVLQLLGRALDSFNYEHVGGVPFLGVNGVSMVGHGSSTPKAIKNMIFNAARCVEMEINRKIVASLKS